MVFLVVQNILHLFFKSGYFIVFIEYTFTVGLTLLVLLNVSLNGFSLI